MSKREFTSTRVGGSASASGSPRGARRPRRVVREPTVAEAERKLTRGYDPHGPGSPESD